IEVGPKPKPVIDSVAVSIQRGAFVAAHTSSATNPTTISDAPSVAVLRNPHLTSSGAATIPLSAQVSITGVTTLAAAVASPPRPPWTYSGTYVSRLRNAAPNKQLPSIAGPTERCMISSVGRI